MSTDKENLRQRLTAASICMTSRKALVLYAICLACADKIRICLHIGGFGFYAVLFSFVFWYATLRVAVRSLAFSFIVLLPLFVDMVVELYSGLAYHVLYKTIVDTAVYTSIGEAAPYLTVPAVLCLLGAFMPVVIFAIMGRLAGRRGALRPLLVWVLIVAGIVSIIKSPAKYYLSMYSQRDEVWGEWLGNDVLQRADVYKCKSYQDIVDREHTEDVYLPCTRLKFWVEAFYGKWFPETYIDCASAPSECTLAEGQRVTVVLYIVESFRRDHSPFHGYFRNTLPMLSKHKDNIIVLPNMQSFGTHSVQSLYGMLSDADDLNRIPRYTSFQALFRKHGFNCILIENNAFGASWTDRPLFQQLLKDSCDSIILVHDDTDFPALTSGYVKEHPRNMFIIYDGTSHHPFKEGAGGRYGDSLADRYDETRHVIDTAAADFLDSMNDTPCIVIITSDHGESLGEGGRICHGSTLAAREQREIFALIWYSDAYAEQFPEIVQALRENAAAFTSQDFFFHTIPSMGGIHSSLRRPEWDMTEPRGEGK